MSNESQAPRMRRVRPWIAALLTFVGWGVGFYYARSRAAWGWGFASVLAAILLLGATIAYVLAAGRLPFAIFDPENLTALDWTQLGLTAAVALVAWIVTARRKEVEHSSPARLFGYLAVWLVPTLFALILAMGVRSFVIQPFRAPSASMAPTVNVGDYFAVRKGSYGYSRYSFAPFESLVPSGRWNAREPELGDVVVFRPVTEPDRDFVKRLVGAPGDRIQMIDGVLHINDVAVMREDVGEWTEGQNFARAYRETLPNGVSYVTLDMGPSELDNTQVYVVPDGHYFMMGDNRDNSADSRVPSAVGFVPADNLLGRVDYIIPAGGTALRAVQ